MAQEKTRQYRFVGSHADVLPNGRPIGPGEYVDLTDEEVRDPYYEMLLADGNLIGTEEQAEHEQSLAERRVARREAKTTEGEEQ